MFALWWQARSRERAAGWGRRRKPLTAFHQLRAGNKTGVGNRVCVVGLQREAVVEDPQRRGVYVL